MAHVAQKSAAPAKAPGRPREFDIDYALDKAVRVFRERGYHATSIADLAARMELASGSIYKAFKDKRAVFLAAFDRYTALRAEQISRAATIGRTGYDRLRNVLLSYAELSRGIEGRRGCLVVGSAVELAAFDPEVATRVADTLAKNQAVIADLIRRGQSDRSIPAHVDAEAASRVLVCLTQGMRVIGKTGRTRLVAENLVDTAMKILA